MKKEENLGRTVRFTLRRPVRGASRDVRLLVKSKSVRTRAINGHGDGWGAVDQALDEFQTHERKGGRREVWF